MLTRSSPAPRLERVKPGLRPAQFLVSALLAAELTAIVSAPWSSHGGALVTTLLLYPLSIPLLALCWWARRRALRLFHRAADRLALAPPFLVFVAAAFTLPAIVGTTLVLHFVVDAPVGIHALAGLVLTLLSSLALAALMTRRLRALPLPSTPPPHGIAIAGVLAGVVLELGDTILLPHEHVGIHGALLAASLLAFSIVLTQLTITPRHLAWLAGLSALMMVTFTLDARRCQGSVYEAIARSYSPHQRVLWAARWILDRDGDGYSALLDGGDCDDDDAAAFPLSTRGRDCLTWIDHAQPPRHRFSPSAPRVVQPPRVVVLVTIDAFRCGFDVAGSPPLRSACPTLTRLADEGRARLDAHANFPVTARAMSVLHSGDLYASPNHSAGAASEIAAQFAAHGYRTRAIVTHPYTLADTGVRDSFGAVDTSLVAAATRASGATADAVTDRVLALLADDTPQFIWAHYLDAHAPYVKRAGDVVAGGALATYAAEVGRTDAALARLANALAARPDAAASFLFVTADHGEAFGEHGAVNHGNSLHEEVMRVPMIAWSAGADHRALGGRRLPRSTAGVASYLAALLTGARLHEDGDVFMRTTSPDDPQLGLIRHGWKLIFHRALNFSELYDLREDPEELHDLSHDLPHRVTLLGRELAFYYRALKEIRFHEREIPLHGGS